MTQEGYGPFQNAYTVGPIQQQQPPQGQMGGPFPQPGGPRPQQAGPPPPPGPPRPDSYYSNCAIVATSNREISVIFGRHVTIYAGTPHQTAVPVYERQILMTVDQVEDLIATMSQAVKDFKERQEESQTED